MTTCADGAPTRGKGLYEEGAPPPAYEAAVSARTSGRPFKATRTATTPSRASSWSERRRKPKSKPIKPRTPRRHRNPSRPAPATATSSDSGGSDDDLNSDPLSHLVQTSSRLLRSSSALLDSHLQVQSALERILIDDPPPPRRTASELDFSTLERRLEALEGDFAQLQVGRTTPETRLCSATVRRDPPRSPVRRAIPDRPSNATISGTIRIHANSQSVASPRSFKFRASAAERSLEQLFARDPSCKRLDLRPATAAKQSS